MEEIDEENVGSGFNKLGLLSIELTQFMGIHDNLIENKAVYTYAHLIKWWNNYIHNLNLTEDNYISPDDKMITLLNLPNRKLRYCEYIKYLLSNLKFDINIDDNEELNQNLDKEMDNILKVKRLKCKTLNPKKRKI